MLMMLPDNMNLLKTHCARTWRTTNKMSKRNEYLRDIWKYHNTQTENIIIQENCYRKETHN